MSMLRDKNAPIIICLYLPLKRVSALEIVVFEIMMPSTPVATATSEMSSSSSFDKSGDILTSNGGCGLLRVFRAFMTFRTQKLGE